MRTIVILLSDTHAGHRLGLMNPETELLNDEGDVYHPTLGPTQEYLWDRYSDYIGRAVQLAHGDRIIPIHHGDVCHGNKYPEQLMREGIDEQIAIAVANLQPWFRIRNVDKMRLVTGTSAHEFADRSATKMTWRYMRSIGDVAFVSHGLLVVDGIEFDVAHRGPSTGIRDWTRGNVLRLYARSIVNRSIKELDQRPPDVISRGHVHSFGHETVRDWHHGKRTQTEAIIIPSMCGMGEHGRSVTQSTMIMETGMIAVEIVDGKIADVHVWIDRQDLRTREEL